MVYTDCMTTLSLSNALNTTVLRNAARMVVAAGVTSVVGWLSVKFGGAHAGTFAAIVGAGTPVYFAAVSLLETKFPKLGWLLGLLPQKKSAVGSKK